MLHKRRSARQDFLYTLPFTPVAGKSCTLYYNPDRTPLRGRPDIYARGAFNRWRHPQPVPPTRLEPDMPGGIGFQKCIVEVWRMGAWRREGRGIGMRMRH